MSILSNLTGIHIKIPGPQNAIGDAIYNSAKSTIPGLSTVDSLLNGVAKAVGGNSGGGLAQSLASLLTGNGGLNALGLAQAANAAITQQKASGLADKALASAEGAYNEKAPLRAQGIQSLLHPQTQDLSELTASRHGLNTQGPDLSGIAPMRDASGLSSIQSLLRTSGPGNTGLPATGDPASLASIQNRLPMGGGAAAGLPSPTEASSLAGLQQRLAPTGPGPTPISMTGALPSARAIPSGSAASPLPATVGASSLQAIKDKLQPKNPASLLPKGAPQGIGSLSQTLRAGNPYAQPQGA